LNQRTSLSGNDSALRIGSPAFNTAIRGFASVSKRSLSAT
jgi:hypothetical protein